MKTVLRLLSICKNEAREPSQSFLNIGFVGISVNILIGLSVSLLTNTLIKRENSQATEDVA
jgi:hypothetical protein